MGAELGATTSVFPFDERMATYLRATDRAELAALAEQHAADLTADPEVEKDPSKFFDEIIEIDLSTLEPHVVGPHTPGSGAAGLAARRRTRKKNGYPDRAHASR